MSGLQRIDYPQAKSSVAYSRRYDHSGSDQILKRRDAIAQLEADRVKALYEGDVVAGITAGKRIRALKESLDGIAPVRVEQEARESSSAGSGGSVHAMPATAETSTTSPRREPGAKDADGVALRRPGDTRPQYGLA